MGYAVPTLTLDGFVEDPTVTMSKLFEYFLTSDYSQSVIFYGKISSLPYILRQYGDDFDGAVTEVKLVLSRLYKKHFSSVEVDANIISDTDGNDIKSYLINISIYAVKDNREYSLIKAVDTTDNNIRVIDDIIDYIMGS